MFVPYTYSALWIYFCIHSYKKDKKLINKKNVSLLSVTLLIPFFLGFIYHLAPTIYNIFNLDAWEALQKSLDFSANILNNSFALEGYIYINYYSNLLLLLPLMIYYIIQKNQKKEILSFDIILLVRNSFIYGVIAIRCKCRKSISILLNEKLLCIMDYSNIYEF